MPNLKSPASNHEIGIYIAVNVCSCHKYNNSNMAKEAAEKVCFNTVVLKVSAEEFSCTCVLFVRSFKLQ